MPTNNSNTSISTAGRRLFSLPKHIGFSDIHFTSFGDSEHAELKGLETREGQQDLNIYIELTK